MVQVEGVGMSDNILIEKIWQDNDLLELSIKCDSKFAVAIQTCYIQVSDLHDICNSIVNCTKYLQKNCYLEFGKKNGNFTPSFSMEIVEITSSGHVIIEVDVEIEDNDIRKHRSCFYVESELGLLEKFGIALKKLIKGDIGDCVSLNN